MGYVQLCVGCPLSKRPAPAALPWVWALRGVALVAWVDFCKRQNQLCLCRNGKHSTVNNSQGVFMWPCYICCCERTSAVGRLEARGVLRREPTAQTDSQDSN